MTDADNLQLLLLFVCLFVAGIGFRMWFRKKLHKIAMRRISDEAIIDRLEEMGIARRPTKAKTTAKPASSGEDK